jgi:hypothetical protein
MFFVPAVTFMSPIRCANRSRKAYTEGALVRRPISRPAITFSPIFIVTREGEWMPRAPEMTSPIFPPIAAAGFRARLALSAMPLPRPTIACLPISSILPGRLLRNPAILPGSCWNQVMTLPPAVTRVVYAPLILSMAPITKPLTDAHTPLTTSRNVLEWL